MTSLHWWSVVLLPATKTNLFWLNILQVIKATYLTQVIGFQEHTGFILKLSTTHNKIKWDFFFLLFFKAMAQICGLQKKTTAWSVPWQKFHTSRSNFKIPLCFKIQIKPIRIWSTVTFNLLRKFTFIPHGEKWIGNTVSNSPEHFEF